MKAWRITLEKETTLVRRLNIKVIGSRLGAWAIETKGKPIFLSRMD